MKEDDNLDYRKIPLSAIPSPPDERDYHITKLIPMAIAFPEEYLMQYDHPIKDQGVIGSCVAHSATYCREIVEEKQRGNYTRLSPGFIYADRVDGDYTGEGMYPRMALKHLRNRGVCEYSLFPENDTFPIVNALLKQRWNTVIPNAVQYKISAYTYLRTVEEIKTALIALGPVTFAIPIYDSFYTVSVDNPIVPMPAGEVQGYHEMTIVGWTKGGWVVLNSWGAEWGENGYCYMPFEYPISEAWGISDNILPGQTYVDEFNAVTGSTLYDRSIKAIVIHHPGDGLPPEISIEQRWNPHEYEYPSYDFGVEYNGAVKAGRPLNIIGAHTLADKAPRNGDQYWYNKNGIGVAVAGDFTKYPMSAAQYNGLVKLVKELMAKYKVPINEVYAHKDLTYTLCPGTLWDFAKFKKDLEDKDMDNLVLYGGYDDGAAKLLAHHLQCPIMHIDYFKAKPISAEKLYMIGGLEKPTPGAILITGKDRYATMQAVLNFIGGK